MTDSTYTQKKKEMWNVLCQWMWQLKQNGRNPRKVKPPKLIQEYANNLNRRIAIKEIEFTVKNLTTKNTQGPDSFNCEFYQTFKKEIISLLICFVS